MSNRVLIGPYIGSFKYEILTFIPFTNYLISVLECDNFVIASHSNREFLYDHIPNKEFKCISNHITRDELNQIGYMYSDVTKTQYNQISKMIKSDIDIKEQHNLPYIKSTNTISYYQKIFVPFNFKAQGNKTQKIIFIPDNSENMKDLYHNIKDIYDVLVLGDMNNGMQMENILLQRLDYFDIVYKYIFESVHTSLFVITTCPEWALICNLQNIPLIYWGDDSSMYKSDGIYGFENDQVISLKHIDTDMVKHMFNKVTKNASI